MSREHQSLGHVRMAAWYWPVRLPMDVVYKDCIKRSAVFFYIFARLQSFLDAMRCLHALYLLIRVRFSSKPLETTHRTPQQCLSGNYGGMALEKWEERTSIQMMRSADMFCYRDLDLQHHYHLLHRFPSCNLVTNEWDSYRRRWCADDISHMECTIFLYPHYSSAGKKTNIKLA